MTAQSAGLEQRARELLAKWRAEADLLASDQDVFAALPHAIRECADELEAALAAAPAADGVLVPDFYAAYVAYAARTLEMTGSECDRLNSLPLRDLEKLLTAAPQAQEEGK